VEATHIVATADEVGRSLPEAQALNLEIEYIRIVQCEYEFYWLICHDEGVAL
jgi:hypothetical protein